MTLIILFILGLCFGSFVNALVFRLRAQSKNSQQPTANSQQYSIINGRSMCTRCGHVLNWYDLLPVVSWLILRGKCRYCAKPISWQYPVVELLTAALFVISYAFWPYALSPMPSALFIAWLALLVMLVALAVYDLKHMLLPDKLVAIGGVIVAVRVIAEAMVEQSGRPLLGALVGAAAFGGLFYVIFQVSSGKWIGGGDVKLGFVLGAWLGNYALSLLAIFAASVLGTAIVVVMAVAGKASLKARLPFGPLLIAGTIVMTLHGQAILDWYTALIIGG